MIVFTNTASNSVAINPRFIESVEPDPNNEQRCTIRMSSGQAHYVSIPRESVLTAMQLEKL